MKVTKISVSLTDKINLATYLGEKYRYCMVEPQFTAELELEPNEEPTEAFLFLRELLNTQAMEYRAQVIESRKINNGVN
jgi:hypothetical protein